MKMSDIIGKLGCDKCDEINGDYEYTLKWNTKIKKFVCSVNPKHKEDIGQALRHFNEDNLFGLVFDALRSEK